MNKTDLSWLKLLSLLILLPLFLWLATLHKTVLQYKELQELRKTPPSEPYFEDSALALYQKNLLIGSYLFNEYLNSAVLDGCKIVSFAPSCDKNEGDLSLYHCHILVKGRFIQLLKLVNNLEQEPDIGYAMLRFSHRSDQEPLVSLDIDLIQLAINE